MQSCCCAGLRSRFSIYYMCKPVSGSALVTCWEITVIGLIKESHVLTPFWLTPKWTMWNGIYEFLNIPSKLFFPCCPPLLFHCSSMPHFWAKFKLVYDWNVSEELILSKTRATVFSVLRACCAVGNFMGSTLGKPLKQHQPSIFSGIDWCLLLSERLTSSSDVMEVVFSRYCHD